MLEAVAIDRDKSRICRGILESLPDWFGIPEAIDEYCEAVATLPMLGAVAGRSVVGFVALKLHTQGAVEAYVLGVRREWHRQGVGRALFAAAEALALARGARFLTVKTVAPMDPPCPYYSQTRRFYEAIGFAPIEVFPTLWHIPCLLMAKVIE